VFVEIALRTGNEVPQHVGSGNHLRVTSAEEQLKTSDSGVAALFRRPWRSGLRDRNVVVADIEYVGELHEIVELNYRGLCVLVLFCKWVKANYARNGATVKKDKWGFTLANFNRIVPFGPESFAFPMHVDRSRFILLRRGKSQDGEWCCEKKSGHVESTEILAQLKMRVCLQ